MKGKMVRLSGVGWIVIALAAASAVVLAPDAGAAARDVTGPSYPAALLGLASLAQLALAAWILVATALSVTARTSRLARAITPRLVRGALFAGAVGAVSLAPAHAEQVVAPGDHAVHSIDGLRLPDRPSDTIAAPVAVRPGPAVATKVVVRSGDTLWAIAARAMPPDASAGAIARATARWHDTNRSVIGSDPDLIFPGQLLTPPLGKDHP